MINKTKIIVDGTISFPTEYMQKYDILVANLEINIDGEAVSGLSNAEIENHIKDGHIVKTSCPSPAIFEELYEKALQEGAENIWVFTIAKSLSGTYNSAVIARKNLDDDIKNSKIKIVDTMQVSYGSTFIVMKAIEMLEKKIAGEAILKRLYELIPRGRFYFIVDNLKTIKKNGRLGLLKYWIAKALHIVPICLYQNGKLSMHKTAIGYKRVKQTFINEVKELYAERADIEIFCADVNAREKTVLLESELTDLFPLAQVYYMGPISNIIAAQIGPGGMGIYINYD